MLNEIIIPFLKHIKYSIRNRSYSQLGEDLVLKNQIERISKNFSRTYLDIGAYHFSIGSNTYGLYQEGWEGTVVDCNMAKLEAFKYFRSRDKILAAAVVPNSYYESSIEINTTGIFDHREGVTDNINQYSTAIEKGSKKTVNAIRIGDLLTHIFSKNGLPTLLSIDIEGLDSNVAKDINFKEEYPIPIVCIEQFLSEFTSSPSILSYAESPLTKHMIDNGYSMTSVCGPSCIYIRNDAIE
jgi:Methyltransferase FkbM domain